MDGGKTDGDPMTRLSVPSFLLLSCLFRYAELRNAPCLPVDGMDANLQGQLSPPENLTVGLLDFQGEVHWCPGRGNPPGTVYSVELIEAGESWAPIVNCTNTTATHCRISFPMVLHDLWKDYFVRAKTTWRDKDSAWVISNSTQPYGDSVLSAPILEVSALNQSILVTMRHRVQCVLPNLKYSVHLLGSTPGQNSVRDTVCNTDSPCVFPNLPPGQRYCVRVSVIHDQQQRWHHSSEACVDLPGHTAVGTKLIMSATVGALLLLAILTGLTLISIRFYLTPWGSDRHMPRSLHVVHGSAIAVMRLPNKYLSQPVLLCTSSASLERGKWPVSPQVYMHWRGLFWPDILPASGNCTDQESEESWDSEGLDWDLSQGVAKPNLSLANGGAWESRESQESEEYHGDGDCVPCPGVSGYLEYTSAAAEPCEETCLLRTTLTHIGGYEPRPDPCLGIPCSDRERNITLGQSQ